MERNEKKLSAKKIIIIILAIIGLATAIVVAIDFLYKKYRKCLSSLNDKDTLEGLDEECFTNGGDEEPIGVDCDFAETEEN